MPTTYAIPDGRVAMAATTYTGTGAALTVSNAVNGVSFQFDWAWVKSRSTVENNFLFDSVRGSAPNYNFLASNLTNAEATPGISMLTAINSNGFTLGTNGGVNTNAATYVAWQWKANGAAVTNTAGSITSQVSANTTAGFSIVTYTGNATSGATVGHGLGVAPSFMIIKSRTQNGVDWPTYHISTGNNGGCTLNETAAKVTTAGWYNNTTPTSTVFSVGSAAQTNGNTQSMVAYCFAAVAGYSAFGSYTGNGSNDGVFVYTGFRPRWILVKRTDSTSGWHLYDTARDTYNAATKRLQPNLSNAENTANGIIDILSNGWKFRNTNTDWDASGGTYIYAAFAETAFKFSNAR